MIDLRARQEDSLVCLRQVLGCCFRWLRLERIWPFVLLSFPAQDWLLNRMVDPLSLLKASSYQSAFGAFWLPVWGIPPGRFVFSRAWPKCCCFDGSHPNRLLSNRIQAKCLSVDDLAPPSSLNSYYNKWLNRKKTLINYMTSPYASSWQSINHLI